MFDPNNPQGMMHTMSGGPTMTPGGGGGGGPPHSVGMVPGVPGSMGLAPGAPSGQFPLNPGMGGPTQGQQVPGAGPFNNHQMPNVNGLMQSLQNWRGQMQDWRGQRPDRQGFDGSQQDWRSQVQDWRGQRPDRPNFMNSLYGAPNGNTGIVPPAMQGQPPQALPPQMPPQQMPPQMVAPPPQGFAAPGVGSQMGVNGAAPATGQYGLPTY